MNTFSVNSLKILDESVENYINKYILKLDFLNQNESAKRGERLHAMISYYLSGFDITKIKNNMPKIEKEMLDRVLDCEIFKDREKFIKSEESFLVKCSGGGFDFYLTGRFDAIFQDGGKYVIYDWKSKNIPKNPDTRLQSIVYLYCASKIFKTQNISIRYISLENLESASADFLDEKGYFERILGIIEKLPKKYLT